jgi:hypothetical protein
MLHRAYLLSRAQTGDILAQELGEDKVLLMFVMQERYGQTVLACVCEGCGLDIVHGLDGYVTYEVDDTGTVTGAWHTFHLACGVMGVGDEGPVDWHRSFVEVLGEMVDGGLGLTARRHSDNPGDLRHVYGLQEAWNYWNLGEMPEEWESQASRWVSWGLVKSDFERAAWLTARWGGKGMIAKWRYFSRCCFGRRDQLSRSNDEATSILE